MSTAEIIPVETAYFEAAKRTRLVARMLKETKRFTEALTLNAEARRLDGIGFCIQAKADALARAEARNASARDFAAGWPEAVSP